VGVTAPQLLADLHARGEVLETDGWRIRWRPAAAVGPELAVVIQASKALLIPLLSPEWCGGCGGRVDARRRCWKCCDRPCEVCGRSTGSAFIRTCSARCADTIPDGPNPSGPTNPEPNPNPTPTTTPTHGGRA
jgi:hypothetical protein